MIAFMHRKEVKLIFDRTFGNRDGIFFVSPLVCHLLRMGVSSIFGPQSNSISSHVQSICDTMEIPHLETRWDYRLRRENCLVNLYPHPSVLSKVIFNEFLENRSLK